MRIVGGCALGRSTLKVLVRLEQMPAEQVQLLRWAAVTAQFLRELGLEP